MTPARSLSPHNAKLGQFGDCHRCCVATILDLPAEDVPHFCQEAIDAGKPESWLPNLRDWLAVRGLGYHVTHFDAHISLELILEMSRVHSPGCPLILGGAAAACATVGHSVVLLDGQIVYDSSGSGICGPCPEDGMWRVESISVGARVHWRAE